MKREKEKEAAPALPVSQSWEPRTSTPYSSIKYDTTGTEIKNTEVNERGFLCVAVVRLFYRCGAK